MIQYYFDMDGVLAIYDRKGYQTNTPTSIKEPENIPDYINTKLHYFRERDIDTRICHAFILMYQQWYNSPKTHLIKCLTTLSTTGSIFMHQYQDKKEWLIHMTKSIISKNPDTFKKINYDQLMHDIDKIIIPAITDKHRIVDALNNKTLNLNHILIDDFNQNLIDWKDAGGLAIKYINGINSAESWKGPTIDKNMTAEEIVKFLNCLSYTL